MLVLAAPAGAAPALAPASKAADLPDAALVAASRARLAGPIRATARAALEGGDVALLAATGPARPGAPIVFALVVLSSEGADAAGGPAVVGHDEIEGIELQGAPTVALSTTELPVSSGAILATVGINAPDGTREERRLLYRVAGGRLNRLHALPPIRNRLADGPGPRISQEIEALPTATGGYRDLRVRTRSRACDGDVDCAEQVDVTSYTFDGVRYAARPYAIPFVGAIKASSELAERGGLVDHSASAAIDGRLDTAWCEGAKGAGWFEKLELTFVPAQRLKALLVVPGDGTGDEFLERTRPKRLRVLLPDGRKVEADLVDAPTAQRIPLPPGDRVFGMTVVIVDVYKGKREDACIAELDLEVEP